MAVGNISWINLFPRITFIGFILFFSQKCDFLNRGYLYLDCAYSSSNDPFEIKLLEEFWQEFTLCIKLKFADALLLLSELAVASYNFR